MFHAAGLLEASVDFRKGAGEGFSVGEEISVVVDEHGQSEFAFEEWAESHAAFESWKIGEAGGEDAVGVVGGTRECEADGCGFVVKLVDDGLESGGEIVEALVEVVSFRGKFKSAGNGFVALEGVKAEVGATGVEGDDDAMILVVHNNIN